MLAEENFSKTEVNFLITEQFFTSKCLVQPKIDHNFGTIFLSEHKNCITTSHFYSIFCDQKFGISYPQYWPCLLYTLVIASQIFYYKSLSSCCLSEVWEAWGDVWKKGLQPFCKKQHIAKLLCNRGAMAQLCKPTFTRSTISALS